MLYTHSQIALVVTQLGRLAYLIEDEMIPGATPALKVPAIHLTQHN